ncbi:IS1/IS1595 family N-terminal zinc-binding domain-containing protein [Phormidium nigroviride]
MSSNRAETYAKAETLDHTKNGKTSTGKQKFKCKQCSKTFSI